jgi:hypothetical protein
VKSKTIWSLAILAIACLFRLSSAGAYSIDGQYNRGPVGTYTSTGTNSGLPQIPPTQLYHAPSHTVQGASGKQRNIAQQQSPLPASKKQILPDNSVGRPKQTSTKQATKKKHTQNAAIRPTNKQIDQRQSPPAAYSSYPNQVAQYRAQPQSGYYHAPALNYYGNQYQNRYTTAPNYYQGSYGGWGSSGQACAPGKA